MSVRAVVVGLAAGLGILGMTPPAHAIFHLWKIKEAFTNHDGSIQFVELFTNAPGETDLANHTLTATSDGNVRTFTLQNDRTTSTLNKHLLIATTGFGAIAGGVAPDETGLPTAFFNPSAASITINFAGVDQITFAGSLLPKDGVHGLTDANPFGAANLGAAVNSPTNFAGATGSVNVPPPAGSPADFNGDGQVDGEDLATVASNFGLAGTAIMAQGDANDDQNVDGADVLIVQRELAVPLAAAVPEPTSVVLAGCLGSALALRRRPW